MLDWLRNLIGPPKSASRTGRAVSTMQRRAYEAARTTRTNQKHWAGVGNPEADAAIIPNLATTRARCRNEIRESVHAVGIMRSFTTHMIGPDGPSPQVHIEEPLAGAPRLAADDDFAEFAERAWRDWCEVADNAGRLHYCDILTQCVKQFFGAGEYLYQRVTDPTATGVQLRIKTIAPERLDTPWEMYSDPRVRGGVRIDANERPIEYYILRDHPGSMFGQMRTAAYDAVPARDICHVYLSEEAGQTRGEPWFAPALDDFAQLRDFISDTRVAARIAATMGSAFIHTNHPQASFQNFENEELPVMDVEAGVAVTLPEGWDVTQFKPEHPSTTYNEFVKSGLAMLGRPVAMPYLLVACDASGHNYSSARLDLQGFWAHIGTIQGFIERCDITPQFRMVVSEAALAAGRRVPRYTVKWTWPPIPSIDQQKEATASQTRLQTGVTTMQAECKAMGADWQEVMQQQARERAFAEAQGIPYAGDVAGKSGGTQTVNDGNDQNSDGNAVAA